MVKFCSGVRGGCVVKVTLVLLRIEGKVSGEVLLRSEGRVLW